MRRASGQEAGRGGAVAERWLVPDWPAPPRVRAASTTRLGGVSGGVVRGWNLSARVGDEPDHVAENRARLRQRLALPEEPVWLEQVHGTRVIELQGHAGAPTADAAFTSRAGVVCAVLTADCLPVLLCDHEGTVVAAVHAGWRGLAGGILETAVAALDRRPERLLGWVGPGIGGHVYRVGADVYRALVDGHSEAVQALTADGARGWYADLNVIARLRLQRLGLTKVFGSHWCTYGDSRRFYSHRRDGLTGRSATLIWLQ